MFARITLCLTVVFFSCAPLLAQGLQISKMAEGFEVPWSLGLLPEGGFLVTERPGRLTHVAPDGQQTRITGLPEIAAIGQGGLLDIVPARSYPEDGRVFFSYVTQVPGGYGLALARAQLDLEGAQLLQQQTLFVLPVGNENGQHFGGRIVEAPDQHLFLTIGDMGEAREAQNLRSLFGKVLRFHLDGSEPRDNPFHSYRKAARAIWSLGHRNPQGATLDSEGQLWVSEHGAMGGDEINQVVGAANYGWPVIAYGKNYDGSKIGQGTSKQGLQQPKFYWDPSIAPSGIVVYSGDMFPEWRGDIFVGSLKFDHIAQVDGTTFLQKDKIALEATGRIRDLRQATDGALWFLSENTGAVYRIWR